MSASSSISSVFWVEASVTAFLSVWNSLLFAIVLIKMRLTTEEDRYLSPKIVVPALLNFGGWSLCFAASTFAKLDGEYKWNSPQWAILVLWGCYSVLYSISFVSSYLFVLSVLFAAFSGSKFEISRCTLSISLTLSAILLLLNVSSLCFLYVLRDAVEVDGLKLSEILGSLCYLLSVVSFEKVHWTLNHHRSRSMTPCCRQSACSINALFRCSLRSDTSLDSLPPTSC